jgi:hypothetical protein
MSLALPPIPPSQKKNDNTTKRTYDGTSIPGSRIPAGGPTLFSNDKIISMFTHVKHHMEKQQKTDQMILKEIENMKSEMKKSVKQMTTPLVPRILDFDTSGSPGNRLEDFIPM